MNEALIVNMMGGVNILKQVVASELDFADVIEKGIPVKSAKYIQSYMNVTDTQMAHYIKVSPKTYRNRKSFKDDEGDHIYVLSKVIVAAEKAIGTKKSALSWLNSKQKSLGNRIPIELIGTSAGVQAVEDILGRIEYGVYS